MKKLLLLTVIAVFGFSNVNAQTEKGSWMFGGDTSLSFASAKATEEYAGEESDDDTTVSTFAFSPNANYFVMDNLAVGLALNFSSSKTDWGGSDDYKTNSLSLIPNATYFFKSDASVVPYLGAGAGLMSAKEEEGSYESQFSGLAIMAKGGIAFFLSDSVALNFGVNFVSSKLTDKDDDDYKVKSSAIGVVAGFAIFL